MRLEVSGGIDATNIRAYAKTGVDYISVGALTHSAPAVDINFRASGCLGEGQRSTSAF